MAPVFRVAAVVALFLTLVCFLDRGGEASAAGFFAVDFESGMGSNLVDTDNAFLLAPGVSLPTTITYREDLDPGSSVDRSYLKTVDSDYTQIGAGNVDFTFDVTLSIEGEGISFVGLGSATPIAHRGNHPGDSVYLRLLEDEQGRQDVQLLFQDADVSDNSLNILESEQISPASTGFLARIEKRGSLISFHLDAGNDGSFEWASATTIDIGADPNGSGADDFRFLQDSGHGHLFVGTGKEEREFDNFRVYLTGDMNGDGQVTEADINPMVLALTDREQYELNFPDIAVELTGDIDQSGEFDLGDLGPFKELLTSPSSGDGMSKSEHAVPEPGSLALALWCLLLRVSLKPRGCRH